MRTFTRLLGVLFVILALVILASDLSAAAKGGDGEFMPLGALWYALDPGSLNLIQAVIERYIWEPLWDPVLVGFLQLPAMPLFAAIGILLIALGFVPLPKRKEPPPPKAPRTSVAEVLKKLAGKTQRKPAEEAPRESVARVEPGMEA